MRSLRGRLLLSLWIAVGVIAVLSAGVAYLQVSRQAKVLLDNLMQQIAAIAVSKSTAAAGGVKDEDSDIEVAVWDSSGALQYSTSAEITRPLSASTGFSEVLVGRERYRLYASVIDGRHVEVAQPVDMREDQAEDAALAALLPMLLLMPVLALVIALVIRAQLRAVKELAAAVARRDTFASTPLPCAALPAEVQPLVQDINRLLARQSEAAQRERHFIADAAHALRTPLAALQLQIDVLDGSSDPVERAARLADLRAGVQRASRLSEQLLSLARVESSLELTGQGADVNETLRDLRELYEPAASAAGVTLDLSGRSRGLIRGAPRHVILICSNLLDNALRYSRCGGKIELRADNSDTGVRIEVWDEGPGLPEDELPRVFERFYRAPGDVSTGSGLGLATVEALVRQLGGRISLHNRADRSGLIARVVLPFAGADHPDASAESADAGARLVRRRQPQEVT
jgi:signal transduction histidine kinase